MDILDDMGVSKLSAKVFSKVNSSFKSFIIWLLKIFHTVEAAPRTVDVKLEEKLQCKWDWLCQ